MGLNSIGPYGSKFNILLRPFLSIFPIITLIGEQRDRLGRVSERTRAYFCPTFHFPHRLVDKKQSIAAIFRTDKPTKF